MKYYQIKNEFGKVDPTKESFTHQENQPSDVKNGYLTSKQAAAYLNISERHLFNLRSTGAIRYFQANRLVRFLKSDLDAYLLKNVMEPFNLNKGGYNG